MSAYKGDSISVLLLQNLHSVQVEFSSLTLTLNLGIYGREWEVLSELVKVTHTLLLLHRLSRK